MSSKKDKSSKGDQPLQIKMISRKPSDFMRKTKHDIPRVQRNYDPKLHPVALLREYQQALNATKLERVFAKPFMGNMSGHGDVVSTLLKHKTSVSIMASGAYDGVVKIWDISKRKCLRTIQAHNSMVRAMCTSTRNPNHFMSVDSESNIKKWRFLGNDQMKILSKADKRIFKKKSAARRNQVDEEEDTSDDDDDNGILDFENEFDYTDDMQSADVPIDTVIAKNIILAMDHHYNEHKFITSGDKIELWDENRKEPTRQWSWSPDSTHYCRFSPVQVNIFATASSDRAISLFDIRAQAPLRKVILTQKSNQICWNPMEAYYFTVANEDTDLHTFDMRNLSKILCLHKDHTKAVIALDYSPTGKELVSGSYDNTIRIFKSKDGRSRDVYHTKRMQRITDVIWSQDSKYIISSSDEMDIRMWRANASEKIGPKFYRERVASETNEALKKKFKNYPEIRRIARHRHLPRGVRNERKLKQTMLDARKRKEQNRRANSKPGSVPIVHEKDKHIVREEE